MGGLNPLVTMVALAYSQGFDPFIHENAKDRAAEKRASYREKEEARKAEYNRIHFGE